MPSGTNSSGLLRAASFTRSDEIAGGFGCSSSITMKVRSEIAAALSLAKLYRDADAHAVLAPAVEGFPPKLTEAQSLLATLSP